MYCLSYCDDFVYVPFMLAYLYEYHALCVLCFPCCTFMLSVYTWGLLLTYVYTLQ